MTERHANQMERLLRKVEYDTNGGCWLWPGREVPGGYGQVPMPGRRSAMAHRLSWQAVHGPIPAGLIVRHKCDVPACFNPEHLEIGTLSDNTRDCLKRGRHVGSGWGNPLTPEQLTWMRDRLSEGWKDARIAQALGVARQSIGRIRKKQRERAAADAPPPIPNPQAREEA